MIWTIAGASGAGKTTLLSNIIRELPDAQPLESITTRQPRLSDLKGEYRYVTEEKFDEMLAAGEFLWSPEARGKRYGTHRVVVEKALNEGLYFPILIPSVLKTLYEFAFLIGKQGSVHSLYLRVEDQEKLRGRLEKRGDSAESIEKSLSESQLWNEQAQTLGLRFVVLDATQTPEEICTKALAVIRKTAH